MIEILISLAPALGLAGPVSSTGLVLAILAIAIFGMASAFRFATLAKIGRVFRPRVLAVLLVPCLWMLLQVAPIKWTANAAWSSASIALNSPITGAITVDVGATLLSLSQYSAVLAVTVVAAAVSIERRFAQLLLRFLATVTVLLATFQVVADLGYFDFLTQHTILGSAEGSSIPIIAIICSCAVVIEQLEKRGGRTRKQIRPSFGLIVAATALLISMLALLVHADASLLLAGIFGAGIPVSIFAIRKWGLGPWGKAGIVTIFIIAILGSLAAIPSKGDADRATASNPQSQSLAERMIADTPPLGSGAGSFDALLPIYADADDRHPLNSKTAAAAITVGMGRSFFWGVILLLAAAALLLCHGSLSRGRDYVYAAVGAGIIVAVLILLFVSSGILGLPTSLLAGMAVGLGWAQRGPSSRAAASRLALETGPERDSPTALFPEGMHIRVAMATFALVLAVQASWLLIPQVYLPRSPAVDNELGPASADQQARLTKAASIAHFRGDLWARSAFAAASALLTLRSGDPGTGQIEDSLTRAARYAPCRSDVWLLLAALADQQRSSRFEPRQLLKMAYYTGPSEIELIPARVKLAFHLQGTAEDAELRDMIRRDVGLILRRFPKLRPELAEAHRSASVEGRRLAQDLISEVDPAYLAAVGNEMSGNPPTSGTRAP